MAGSYSWITFAQAVQQLAQRLADPNLQFWTKAELQIYIQQALRIFNSLTWTWRKDFKFDSTRIWNSLGSLTGSPRQRTLTDTYCYTELEYMLLEPASGGTWTGTSQFNIAVLSDALQGTRDDMIQVSNCNQSLMSGIPLTPNTIRTELPDTVIDVPRVRYMFDVLSTIALYTLGTSVIFADTTGMSVGQIVFGPGINYSTIIALGFDQHAETTTVTLSAPTTEPAEGAEIQIFQGLTLYRDDTIANEFYEPPLYELASGTPQTFSLSSEPPLSWNVDIPPNQAGTYEAIVLLSGEPFNPPADTLLGIPDDFAWVAEWGALAELLGRDSEAIDRERAAYAQKMYQEGINLMTKTPWILLGKVNGAAVSLDSIYAMDRFSPEWDSDPVNFGPVIVTGGIDFIGSPIGTGLGVTVLGNAPVPTVDGEFVQASRSNFDTILDIAQARASFKMGGSEWKAALELEERAIKACAAENSRLRSMGAFSDILVERGRQQERDMNRYNNRGDKG